jgi:hypothetical protein
LHKFDRHVDATVCKPLQEKSDSVLLGLYGDPVVVYFDGKSAASLLRFSAVLDRMRPYQDDAVGYAGREARIRKGRLRTHTRTMVRDMETFWLWFSTHAHELANAALAAESGQVGAEPLRAFEEQVARLGDFGLRLGSSRGASAQRPRSPRTRPITTEDDGLCPTPARYRHRSLLQVAGER